MPISAAFPCALCQLEAVYHGAELTAVESGAKSRSKMLFAIVILLELLYITCKHEHIRMRGIRTLTTTI